MLYAYWLRWALPQHIGTNEKTEVYNTLVTWPRPHSWWVLEVDFGPKKNPSPDHILWVNRLYSLRLGLQSCISILKWSLKSVHVSPPSIWIRFGIHPLSPPSLKHLPNKPSDLHSFPLTVLPGTIRLIFLKRQSLWLKTCSAFSLSLVYNSPYQWLIERFIIISSLKLTCLSNWPSFTYCNAILSLPSTLVSPLPFLAGFCWLQVAAKVYLDGKAPTHLHPGLP